MTKELSANQWLAMPPSTVTQQFGGSFAQEAFVDGIKSEALPVLLPAYNHESSDEVPRLPWALASLAVASRHSGQAVRPMVIINGPEEGSATAVCEDFRLEPDKQVFWQSDKGKVRALQTGARILLEEEGYIGPFATIDDDGIIPALWPRRAAEYMRQANQDAVSGGTVRYHATPGVSSALVGLRNVGVRYHEWREGRRVGVCAHGNNQWFMAAPSGLVQKGIQSLDPNLGRRGDAAIVAAVQREGATALPLDPHPNGRVSAAGNRTKNFRDLVGRILGDGASRYSDPIWGDMPPFTED